MAKGNYVKYSIISGEQKGWRNPRGGRRKLKVALGTLLVLIIGIFSVIPPLIIGQFVNMHVDFPKTYAAEEFGITSESLRLTTEDGLTIAAYEVFTPDPEAVVIFLSGIHNPSVTAFFGHAKMLQEKGYASILIEMRAHGESEGNVISLGFKEYLDTKAVVDYIKAKDEYRDVPIVVYGVSMGGATAINSFGQIKEIDGLVSLSAYSAWEDVFYDNMVYMGIPKVIAYIQKPFVKGYTTIKYGLQSFHMSPKNEIKKAGDRPVFIMHSEEDHEVPFPSFERILKNAPEQTETWVREGEHHFIVNRDSLLHPQEDQEYAKRLLDFLDRNFRN